MQNRNRENGENLVVSPQLLDQIHQGAQLVFLPEYDPELCKENLKLTPQKSRIKKLTIELAKAG